MRERNGGASKRGLSVWRLTGRKCSMTPLSSSLCRKARSASRARRLQYNTAAQHSQHQQAVVSKTHATGAVHRTRGFDGWAVCGVPLTRPRTCGAELPGSRAPHWSVRTRSRRATHPTQPHRAQGRKRRSLQATDGAEEREEAATQRCEGVRTTQPDHLPAWISVAQAARASHHFPLSLWCTQPCVWQAE